jgi:putative tributyrin esterase
MALLHCNFKSETLQIAASMDVILPQKPRFKGKFQTLYLLHGLSDDHTIWQRRTSIERYVDDLNLAVVMPAVNRSFYANMASGPRYWDFISQEVPAVARAFFPLSDKRQDNFVAGLSMGGYGAFKLALSQPRRFAAAASLSGALDMSYRIEGGDDAFAAELKHIFGKGVKGSDNDLLHLATQLSTRKTPRPRLFQCCGTEDFLYEHNTRFRDHATTSGLKLEYREGPGGHTWDFWDEYIQQVLDWLPLAGKK